MLALVDWCVSRLQLAISVFIAYRRGCQNYTGNTGLKAQALGAGHLGNLRDSHAHHRCSCIALSWSGTSSPASHACAKHVVRFAAGYAMQQRFQAGG